jgi:DNA invertase Pin-like site-specific DNA recombinase
MMGIFAEFERALIVERTMAGLARARANGRRLGRPRINGDLESAVRASLASDIGIQRTAKQVGVGVGTVQRIKRAMVLA